MADKVELGLSLYVSQPVEDDDSPADVWMHKKSPDGSVWFPPQEVSVIIIVFL
jgi:hypothetical protein